MAFRSPIQVKPPSVEVDARTKWSSKSIWLGLAVLAGLYTALYQSYRAYEIDNPWYLSFSRNLWVDDNVRDSFLYGVFPDGMGGTAVFGGLAARLQGAALDPLHWQAGPATALSSALVLTSLAVWYLFLKRSGLSENRAAAIVIAMGFTEPFVGAAERFRYEPLSFLFFSSAFLAAEKRWTTLALFLSLLALETEPAAILAVAALLLYLVETKQGPMSRTLLAPALFASGAFLLLYFALHPNIVATLQQTNWHRGSGQRQLGGFLRAYFLERKRHLPEMVLLLCAFGYFLRKSTTAPTIVRLCAHLTVLVSLLSFVLNWPTPAYMVFFYPAALVVAAWSLKQLWSPDWALAAVACLLIVPQYVFLAYINMHEGFRSSEIAKVSQGIARAESRLGLDEADTRIMGDYSLWFAHPERYTALAATTLADASSFNLFLCFDRPLLRPTMVDPIVRYCQDLQAEVSLREADRFLVRGHMLHLLVRPAAMSAASKLSPGLSHPLTPPLR